MVESSTVYTWYYNSSFNNPLSIIFIIIIVLIIFYMVNKYVESKTIFNKQTTTNSKGVQTNQNPFYWLYTINNNNSYILLTIVILLALLIFALNWYLQKEGSSNDLKPTMKLKDSFSNDNTETTEDPPQITNAKSSYIISDADKDKWVNIMKSMDIDEGTVVNSSDTSNAAINQKTSTLYGDSDFVASYNNGGNNSNISLSSANGSTIASYATLDSLGKSLTDTLGGVDTSLGYTIIDEQLGTFKASNNTGKTYDNTLNYKSSSSPDNLESANAVMGGQTCDGKYKKANGAPIFLQKDFEGVANIFAPNIYIANSPFNDDGYPDINFNINGPVVTIPQTTE
jgi:hypothetical protein